MKASHGIAPFTITPSNTWRRCNPPCNVSYSIRNQGDSSCRLASQRIGHGGQWAVPLVELSGRLLLGLLKSKVHFPLDFLPPPPYVSGTGAPVTMVASPNIGGSRPSRIPPFRNCSPANIPSAPLVQASSCFRRPAFMSQGTPSRLGLPPCGLALPLLCGFPPCSWSPCGSAVPFSSFWSALILPRGCPSLGRPGSLYRLFPGEHSGALCHCAAQSLRVACLPLSSAGLCYGLVERISNRLSLSLALTDHRAHSGLRLPESHESAACPQSMVTALVAGLMPLSACGFVIAGSTSDPAYRIPALGQRNRHHIVLRPLLSFPLGSNRNQTDRSFIRRIAYDCP